MKSIYDKISIRNSKMLTKAYSTSFSLGIRFLATRFQNPIYAVYGFVRLADEIVDSFHGYPKAQMLAELKEETFKAIERGISTNPILNSFQEVVNTYQIDHENILTFLKSMEMDLEDQTYNQQAYEEYILGSAEVVGLMCLRVFTEGNDAMYQTLKPAAMKLGSAFQKINFLRDFKADKDGLGRMYFPQLQSQAFNEHTKRQIEEDVLKDFQDGYEGIKKLPKDARFGVYVAYIYYSRLLNKIVTLPPQAILEERVRISDKQKYALFFGSYLRHSFNLL
ncbi:MAG: phytoene/squalene synthase family protein [Sphingobacteriales bacterium]|jgi:phytoene synthase|nr:phytoene/squalene synthase family protein [Sphingobacteriales bacterium]